MPSLGGGVRLGREVIQRRPQEFKIAVLTDIMRLFKGRNPFYAGFGNRETVRSDQRSRLGL